MSSEILKKQTDQNGSGFKFNLEKIGIGFTIFSTVISGMYYLSNLGNQVSSQKVIFEQKIDDLQKDLSSSSALMEQKTDAQGKKIEAQGTKIDVSVTEIKEIIRFLWLQYPCL